MASVFWIQVRMGGLLEESGIKFKLSLRGDLKRKSGVLSMEF